MCHFFLNDFVPERRHVVLILTGVDTGAFRSVFGALLGGGDIGHGG